MNRNTLRMLSVIGLAFGLLALIASASAQEIPLLPEDTPPDVYELGLGPWDGNWVIESSVRDGLEVTTYFCSNELGRECLGTLYARIEPGMCAVGCAGADCTGACQGKGDARRKDIARNCQQDSDCPMTDSDSTCAKAKTEATDNATKTCKDKGGADCVCYAHAKVTKTNGHCTHAFLGNYCKYTCNAEARGTCAQEWKADATPAPVPR